MNLTRDAPEFIVLKGPDFSGPFIVILIWQSQLQMTVVCIRMTMLL